MSKIDRAGTFRGRILEKGVSVTQKSGLPQFVARFQAVEYYDTETQQWVDWTPYDVNEITGYFVLVSNDGKWTLNSEQIKKATGWTGASFSELDAADYSNLLVQFRVENTVYNNKPDLQVNWIDHVDADPSRSLRKLDAGEVKGLDAKFAAILGGSKPKPVSKPTTPAPKAPATPATPPAAPKAPATPATPPAAPKAPATPATPPAAPEQKPEEKPATGSKSTRKPPGRDKKAEATKKEPEAASKVAEVFGLPAACTEQEAWNAVEKHAAKDTPSSQIEETWLKAIEDLGGAEAVDKENAWASVRDIVIEQTTDEPTFGK